MKLPRVLENYYARIGAEVLNFRRAMVKEHRGAYYTERALIKVSHDGEVTCSNKEYAPTAEEAAAIKAAISSSSDFPRAILAKDISLLKKQINKGSELYEFLSNKPGEDGIIMVQERTSLKTGQKVYIPWTFFSDGEWRKMEPDGLLPFWKPDPSIKRARIMVHEGAKAARAVSQLIHDPKKMAEHPWGEFLYQYAHWGMIGGALAPHRADYDEIRREKPLEVVYVCDNDWPGKSALQEVSRSYQGSMKGVMFDSRWPQSWDMADPMPEGLYVKKRYMGPRLRDLMVAATRATEMVFSAEGKASIITRRAFREEWVHSVTPEVYIHGEWPNRMLTASEFNNDVAPYSDADDTARLLKKDAASKTAMLKYDPSFKPGIYGSGDGGRFVNTHVPSDILPEKGDPAPFLEFMADLVTVDVDRLELMRWAATLIARPSVRILYGVLMISENQGMGKGTLGEKILAPLVGKSNVSYPSENEIVDSNFNYWLAHKRLAVVHEIYAGHSTKAYNKMKSIITDKYVTVSKKYMANYEVENWLHVFACSNSKRAIQLSGDDRRWHVPKLTEQKKPAAYWTRLNKWLTDEGGLGIIRWWADEFLRENEPVEQGASAPWSELKMEVVKEGYSPGMTLVLSFLERVKEEMENPQWALTHCGSAEGVLVLDTDLVKLIRDHHHDGRHSDRLEKPLTLRKVAKLIGFMENEQRASIEKWGTRGTAARLLCSTDELARASPRELSEKMRPLDVGKLAQEWRL
jgi:hypothetical protein